MSEDTKQAEEPKGKVARYYLGGEPTITVKDAEGEEREVANPAFRFYRGIPARDLTEEEYEALTDEQKAIVDEGHVTETRDTGRRRGGAAVLEEVRERLYQRTKPAARKE